MHPTCRCGDMIRWSVSKNSWLHESDITEHPARPESDSEPYSEYDDDDLHVEAKPEVRRFRQETRYPHKRSEGLRGSRGLA
jgi:hypothetical protein